MAFYSGLNTSVFGERKAYIKAFDNGVSLHQQDLSWAFMDSYPGIRDSNGFKGGDLCLAYLT
jgi:hypothetical protein